MTQEMNKLGFGADGRRMGVMRPYVTPLMRPLAVSAASLTIAGLLGACASQPATAPSGPSPTGGPQAAGSGATRVFVSLKNAESAFADYARALRRESDLRKAVEAASNAALVARHRQSIAPTDFVVAGAADSRLAAARRDLRMGEAATRAARGRLYRALGMDEDTALNGRGAAGGQVKLPLPADRAQPFQPDASL